MWELCFIRREDIESFRHLDSPTKYDHDRNQIVQSKDADVQWKDADAQVRWDRGWM